MRILLSGCCGHMGAEVIKVAKESKKDIVIKAGVDVMMTEEFGEIPCVSSYAEADPDVDVVIDFSHHSCTKDLVDFATEHKLPLVIATTGQTEEEKKMIDDAAKKVPLFYAANYSLGIALLIELAKKTAATMSDAEIEIVEVHHDRKVDAPSGTALAIAGAVKEVRPGSEIVCGRNGLKKREPEDIGVSAVRLGNVVGIHEVLIGTNNQTITLKHEAHSRALFAEGALSAAEFLIGKNPGAYNMNDLVSF